MFEIKGIARTARGARVAYIGHFWAFLGYLYMQMSLAYDLRSMGCSVSSYPCVELFLEPN